MNESVAIIGGGIGGLTAAYLLRRKYEITLFEKTNRVGGNAYTHKTRSGLETDVCVAAYSRLVSKNFFKLLDELDVPRVRQPGKALLTVYNPETKEGVYLTPFSLKGLRAQKFQMLRKDDFWDLTMANWYMGKGARLYRQGRMRGMTMRQAFELLPGMKKGNRMMLTLVPLCLLSSMYYEEILESPAEFFFKKISAFGDFHPYHQMFGLYFPKNLTRSYVDALKSHFAESIVLNAKIRTVLRDKEGVTLVMEDGEKRRFNHVVFACNADQALALLEQPSADEDRLLGAWSYHDGRMVLHTDASAFPPRELCQTWTALESKTKDGGRHFSITGCTWKGVPSLPEDSNIFATQYPNFPIREEAIELDRTFRTPIFDFKAMETVNELPSLNGKQHSYYCGSHFGLGLHNDAVTSAVEAARALGVDW